MSGGNSTTRFHLIKYISFRYSCELINNLHRLQINDSEYYLISSFKIITRYCDFNVIKELLDQYPNNSFIDLLYPYPKYKFKGSDKTQYILESGGQANIVIYVNTTNNSEMNRNNIRQLVAILLELFPDELNISSGDVPRFDGIIAADKHLELCTGKSPQGRSNSRPLLRRR